MSNAVTMPSVHGRINDGPHPKQRNRIGYHQRNLSLDFRSMGILLPPIPHVTSQVSSHHRNRSLDSVLQRIPEVETPSPDCETSSITESSNENSISKSACNKEDITSLGSDDSGISRCEINGSGSTSDPSSQESESESPMIDCRPPENGAQNKSFLFRLFESTLFNMSMAITYLFNSKEPGVQSYIGNKLFSFSHNDVDFYLPQLIHMYIQMEDLSEVIHPYFIFRSQNSADFALKCSWLLDAYSIDTPLPCKKSRGANLKELINNESSSQEEVNSIANFKKSHIRTTSDASAIPNQKQNSQPRDRKKSLGDLSSGHCFDNGCICFESCQYVNGAQIPCDCGAPRLLGQLSFISMLTNIGNVLKNIPTKDGRSAKLMAEIVSINTNLPARVWIPLYSDKPHHIVRIPPNLSAVLNSKDKAPYIIYVEVVEVDNIEKSILIPKIENSLRPTRSEENVSCIFEIQHTVKKNSDQISCHETQTKKQNEITQKSSESSDSNVLIAAGDIRKRLAESLNNAEPFSHDPNDPSLAALKEPWNEKVKRARDSSPYGHFLNWNLLPVIVKTGDDLRQELLASQLITMLQNIWNMEQTPLWLYPYKILCLSTDSGLIEPIVNTISLHQIKKNGKYATLLDYFTQEYGSKDTYSFLNAQQNFVRSCAAYSILCYLIQIKDRHNGNILLTSQGHIIHIDFGYILSTSPKNLGFESSPFKLTSEFVAVMGGFDSPMFNYYKILILQGLLAARKHMDQIISLVEIMRSGSQLPCFKMGASAIQTLKNRFHLNLTEPQLQSLVDTLVESSVHSLSTKLYDRFQYITNGIR